MAYKSYSGLPLNPTHQKVMDQVYMWEQSDLCALMEDIINDSPEALVMVQRLIGQVPTPN